MRKYLLLSSVFLITTTTVILLLSSRRADVNVKPANVKTRKATKEVNNLKNSNSARPRTKVTPYFGSIEDLPPIYRDKIKNYVEANDTEDPRETVKQERQTALPSPNSLPTRGQQNLEDNSRYAREFELNDRLNQRDGALEALRELTGQSNLLPGMVKREINTPAVPTPIIIPTETPKPRARLSGQPRGFVLLPLMFKKARPAIIKRIQALKDAEIQQVFVGVLVDGTFGKDTDFLLKTLDQLSEDKREISLLLYLTNGPAMTKIPFLSIPEGFHIVPLEQFEPLILRDARIRNEFRSLCENTKKIVEHNRKLSPYNRNLLSVMLEDPFSAETYENMEAIAKSIFGSSVEYVRNSEFGLAEKVPGSIIETHYPDEIEELDSYSGLTLDGVGFKYSWESDAQQPGVSDVRALSRRALEKRASYFALWRPEYQGITEPLKHPSEREFPVPSDAAIQEEISILREGLLAY